MSYVKALNKGIKLLVWACVLGVSAGYASNLLAMALKSYVEGISSQQSLRLIQLVEVAELNLPDGKGSKEV